MRPECLNREDALAQAAARCKLAERTATLDHVCAGDQPLDRGVESSSFQEDASTLAETLPLEHADRLLTDSQAGLTEGRTLGHYKIIRRLDSGGCGKVYLARVDRLNRLVAIKILFGLVSFDFNGDMGKTGGYRHTSVPDYKIQSR
jgi:hypothetical protein